MINKKEIFKKIKKVFKIEFTNYDKEINLNTSFEDIKGEKLGKREFLLQIEELFELRIAPRNLHKINTINDLVEHLYRLL